MAKIAVQDIISSLKEMKLTEINELVKGIEEEFGVSAAAPVAAAGAGGAAEASSEVKLTLKSAGPNKVAVIKVVKEILGLGLMDAKKFAESAPILIKEGIKPEAAEELAVKFKEAGAEVEIK